MEFSDNELLSMVNDFDEEAKDTIYKKYNYIIDIIINKYKKSIYALNIDLNDVRQDAMLAFSDALVRYQQEKDSSLPTFISLCVERKLQNIIRNADTTKNKINAFAVSLEHSQEINQRPLEELIGDSTMDPLARLEDEENYQELLITINGLLSDFEKDVYNLVINGFSYIEIANILKKEPKQIDNTIQRIRNKLKFKV